jgi:hypothetical protein
MTVTGFADLGITMSRLVTDTLRHLRVDDTGQINRLTDGSMTADTENIEWEFVDTQILPGRAIEIDDELMHVWTVDGDARTGVVQRAMQGTTAAAHGGLSIIRVEPRFSRKSILDALRDEIESWPAQLYGIVHWTGSISNQRSSVELDGLEGYSGLRFLRAGRESRFSSTDSDTRYPTLGGIGLEVGYATDGYPSGPVLRWNEQVQYAGDVRVVLGAHFQTQIFTSAVDVGSIGLSRSMLDIAPIGAAARLLFPEETERSDTAALVRSRVATDVPPGATSQVAQTLLAWRNQRISEEVLRLLSEYGWTER